MEGRLHTSTYEANDGTTRFTHEVTASDVRFLDRRERDSGYSGGDYPSGPGGGITEPDDLPF